MAEAIALLGVVASAIQCADVGFRVLRTGAQLCSKFSDASAVVKRSLEQVQQLIEIVESIRALLTSLSMSSLSTTPSSNLTGVSWAQAAMQTCIDRAQHLERTLASMDAAAGDGKVKLFWMKILTVKREKEILTIFEEIEQQKSTLSMWLAQNNLIHLSLLGRKVDSIQGQVATTGGLALLKESLGQEMKKTTQDSIIPISNQLSSMENLSSVGFSKLRENMEQQYSQHIVQSSTTGAHLAVLGKEMKEMKREMYKLRKLQARALSKPSFLKEALDKQNHAMVFDQTSTAKKPRPPPGIDFDTLRCTCGFINWAATLKSGRQNRLEIYHRRSCSTHCTQHSDIKTKSMLAIFYRTQFLKLATDICFKASYGAGGFSIGLYLKPICRVNLLPCFFLLNSILSSTSYEDRMKNRGTRKIIFTMLCNRLLTIYQAGEASLNDIDYHGRTLIHYLVERAIPFEGNGHPEFLADIARFLVSLGAKTSIYNDNLRTAQQELIAYPYHDVKQTVTPFGETLLDWHELKVDHAWFTGSHIIHYMRCWPESRADFGSPFISDIILRKSQIDLELFISRGMQPVEQSPYGLTPLHLAAAADWYEGIDLLLRARACKFTKDIWSHFPIDYALENGSAGSACLLLEGDCAAYFVEPPEENRVVPRSWADNIWLWDKNIQVAVVRVLVTHAANGNRFNEIGIPDTAKDVSFSNVLVSAGLFDLESWNRVGKTPLQTACSTKNFRQIDALIKIGAETATMHRDVAVTAGHFLTQIDYEYSGTYDWQLVANVIKAGFDASRQRASPCRCSPGGYSPISTLMYSDVPTWMKVDIFHDIILLIEWPVGFAEEQARAFALGEVFCRLEMTHTCMKLFRYGTLGYRESLVEDRVEIEDEEEEVNCQLEGFMTQYDLRRSNSRAAPLDFLDDFLEQLDEALPSFCKAGYEYAPSQRGDLLTPVDNMPGGKWKPYASYRYSYEGDIILYDHHEQPTEENILDLLFGSDHAMI